MTNHSSDIITLNSGMATVAELCASADWKDVTPVTPSNKKRRGAGRFELGKLAS
jgi:hypothetical protein